MRSVRDTSKLSRLLVRRAVLPSAEESLHTHIPLLNALAPGGGFQHRALHELLYAAAGPAPVSVALLLAAAAVRSPHRGSRTSAVVAWSDPGRELYAPALPAAGLPLDRVLLLRPRTAADELRMLVECLRCPGVAATFAAVGRLSRVEARRLQLAAERGGGVAVLMRRGDDRAASVYAAATRWRVTPEPGTGTAQRWRVELMHGHGGRVGESVLLEVDRESGQVHAVRLPAAVADRPVAAAAARASA